MRKLPKITPEMISITEAYLVAKAHTETIRAIVEPLQKRVLEDGQYPAINEYVVEERSKPVLNPDNTFLMSDADFQEYMFKTRELYEAAGLHTENPDECPLLVAENLERQAKRAMLEVATEQIIRSRVPGFDLDLVYAHGPETLDKVVDLTLKIVVPFVRKGRTGGQVLDDFLAKKS